MIPAKLETPREMYPGGTQFKCIQVGLYVKLNARREVWKEWSRSRWQDVLIKGWKLKPVEKKDYPVERRVHRKE